MTALEYGGPGCSRHEGAPHNLCQACWALEPDPVYEGSFSLAWLLPGESVRSAGDGTGAAIVVGPDGSERRVEIGDVARQPAEDAATPCERVLVALGRLQAVAEGTPNAPLIAELVEAMASDTLAAELRQEVEFLRAELAHRDPAENPFAVALEMAERALADAEKIILGRSIAWVGSVTLEGVRICLREGRWPDSQECAIALARRRETP